MSIQSTCTALTEIGAGLAVTNGVETKRLIAFDPPPVKLDTGDLPAVFVLTRGATYDPETLGDAELIEQRTYAVRVVLLPEGQSTPALIEQWLRASVPVLRDAYASRPSLGGIGVRARIVNDSGPLRFTEYNAIGFELQLQITENQRRTYAARE